MSQWSIRIFIPWNLSLVYILSLHRYYGGINPTSEMAPSLFRSYPSVILSLHWSYYYNITHIHQNSLNEINLKETPLREPILLVSQVDQPEAAGLQRASCLPPWISTLYPLQIRTRRRRNPIAVAQLKPPEINLNQKCLVKIAHQIHRYNL